MTTAMTNRARIETPLGRILAEEGRKLTWLALQVGASKQEVWRWVHGLHVPVAAMQGAIADALGRPVEDLWPDAPVEPRRAA